MKEKIGLVNNVTRKYNAIFDPVTLEKELYKSLNQDEVSFEVQFKERTFHLSLTEETEMVSVVEYTKGKLIKSTEFYFSESAIDELLDIINDDLKECQS
ncbi:hypothetical protein MKY91_20630 [Alkalicoccobacillus gibsonii]|uniref:Uncharacterized protein n=1 Tax=Alkalicoccobacillus gibsonii TaxID=79881 RepID=A0ABU9VNT3_9BACI